MPRGTGHVYLRGQIWWLRYYVDGKPRYESAETDNKTAAVRLLKQRLGKPKPASVDSRMTVGDLMANCLAFYRTHRPKSYESFALPVSAHLVQGLGTVRGLKLSSSILQNYVETRQSENASNATINREMELLRRAYNLAREDRKIDRDSIPTFRRLKESEPRQGFLEPEQYRKLLDELPRDLKPALMIAYHTGLRKSKVLGLRINQFDLAGRKLYLDPEQNAVKKVPAVVPLYGEMVEFIERHIRETQETLPDCRWFCHRANGDPVMEIRPAWDDAAVAAGMPGLLFHDLRRSAVRNMVRAGIPEGVAMKISGHKTRSVFERYNIVSTRDLDDAGEKMEMYLGRKTKGAGE